MSHRPIIDKKIAKLGKLLRRTSPPAYIDLVQWLKDRRYAQTTGEAERIILAGRVKSESHTLGIYKVEKPKLSKLQVRLGQVEALETETVDAVDRYVPARLRGTITVIGQ